MKLKFTAASFFIIIISATQLCKAQSYNPISSRQLIATGAVLEGLCGATLISSLTINAVRFSQSVMASLNANQYTNANFANTGNDLNFLVPPRIILGATSIVYGSIITYMYSGTNYYLDKRVYRVGISDIALGASAIILPPLLNLVFTKNEKKQNNAPNVDVGLYLPKSATGNTAYGLTVYGTF
jgi:hypothetical protein